MANKIVSIIIPYHDEGLPILMRALMSINGQVGVDLDSLEVIIVSDGGERLKLKRCHELMPKLTIRYRYHKKVRGMGATRQQGMDVATGQFITFLDVDDEFYSDRVIRHFIDVLLKSGNHQIIVGHTMELTQHDDGSQYLIDRGYDQRYAGGKWFNRKFLVNYQLKWRDDLHAYEDMYFIGTAFKLATNISKLDQPVYVCPWRNDSADRQQNGELDQWVKATSATFEKLAAYKPESLSQYFLVYMADIYLRAAKYPANDSEKFRQVHAAFVRQYGSLWPKIKPELKDLVHQIVTGPGEFHGDSEVELPHFIAMHDDLIAGGVSA